MTIHTPILRADAPGLLTSSAAYKPFRYPWAFDMWKKQQQVHWMPEEVPLGEDCKDWAANLTDADRNPQAFAQELGQSFVDYGFAIVRDHVISQDLIERAEAKAKEFFALPDAVKRNYLIPGGGGARGYTAFGVETAKAGFSRGRKLDKVGQDESDTAEMSFTDLRCTDADIIGELDQGFIHMMQNLPQERLGCAISNLAHARQILEETLQYAKDRKAFGQGVGSFQHNKFLLAELFTQVDVTQAYVDQCVVAHAAKELTPIDAAKAKWWTSQVQNEILDHCVQLHGGYGFMNEYRVARAWRDARVSKIWAGSNEIMKELIGRDLGL